MYRIVRNFVVHFPQREGCALALAGNFGPVAGKEHSQFLRVLQNKKRFSQILIDIAAMHDPW